MKNLIIFSFILSAYLFAQSVKSQNVDSIYNSLIGIYLPLLYCEEAYPDIAKLNEGVHAYLKKQLIIDSTQVLLFDEELSNFKLSMEIMPSKKYFQAFKMFDFNCFMPLMDKTLIVLTLYFDMSVPKTPREILLTDKFIVINYLGVFFFFNRTK